MPTLSTYRNWLPVLVGLSLLASCGFHLRGALDLPAQWTPLHITGYDRALVAELATALQNRGLPVAASSTAAAVIDLRTSQFNRSVLSTDANGRATAYEVQYEVAFTAAVRDHQALPATQTITLKRAYQYQPNQHLQAEAEYSFLQATMRREAVSRLLQRLVSLSH